MVYQTSPLTAAGDGRGRISSTISSTARSLAFSPQAGIGTAAAPFSGSLAIFMRQVISQQGEAAQAAASLKQGQDVVVNSLQQRFNDSAGVNIDEEMANLLKLQNCLCRQCAGDVGGQGHARHADEDVSDAHEHYRRRIAIVAGRAVAGRHAPPARRSAAPARHRQEVDTYAGLGLDRGFAVGLRAQLSALDGYADTITNVGVRINLRRPRSAAWADIAHASKAPRAGNEHRRPAVRPRSQSTAYSELDEILGLLNTQAGDRYLFSGRATDQPAAESLDHIMNGDGARAGLKQVIAERNQADLGASGLGRLAISRADGDLGAARRRRGSRRSGSSSPASPRRLSSATVTAVRAAACFLGRSRVSFRTTATPSNFASRCPTDQREHHADRHEFGQPGAEPVHHRRDRNVTAANLQTALTTAVGKLAGTSLSAASAMAASGDFFGDRRSALPVRPSPPRPPRSRARRPTP